MKYLEISVGKSLDPNTGSEWVRCDAKVSLSEEESNDPEEVFKKVRAEINRWLPNPYDYPTVGKSGYFNQPKY